MLTQALNFVGTETTVWQVRAHVQHSSSRSHLQGARWGCAQQKAQLLRYQDSVTCAPVVKACCADVLRTASQLILRMPGRLHLESTGVWKEELA